MWITSLTDRERVGWYIDWQKLLWIVSLTDKEKIYYYIDWQRLLWIVSLTDKEKVCCYIDWQILLWIASLTDNDEWYHGIMELVLQTDIVLVHVIGSNDKSSGTMPCLWHVATSSSVWILSNNWSEALPFNLSTSLMGWLIAYGHSQNQWYR